MFFNRIQSEPSLYLFLKKVPAWFFIGKINQRMDEKQNDNKRINQRDES